MKNYDSVIIGHITEDHNIDHLDNEVHICGGAVLFSSAYHFIGEIAVNKPCKMIYFAAHVIGNIFCFKAVAQRKTAAQNRRRRSGNNDRS